MISEWVHIFQSGPEIYVQGVLIFQNIRTGGHHFRGKQILHDSSALFGGPVQTAPVAPPPLVALHIVNVNINVNNILHNGSM